MCASQETARQQEEAWHRTATAPNDNSTQNTIKLASTRHYTARHCTARCDTARHVDGTARNTNKTEKAKKKATRTHTTRQRPDTANHQDCTPATTRLPARDLSGPRNQQPQHRYATNKQIQINKAIKNNVNKLKKTI